MKRSIIALLLAGCGGGGGGSAPAPAPASTPEPVAATIAKSAAGCLLSDNAEATADYQLGAGQAKTLLWSCANIGSSSRVGVEAFYTLDSAKQCFVEQAVISKAGDCSKRAAAPAAPAVTASVRTINPPTMTNIGGGFYALNLDAEVTATGNLAAVGAAIQVASTCVGFCPLNSGQPAFFQVDKIGNSSLSGLPNVLPGQAISHIFAPVRSGSTSPGDRYTFTLTVLDIFGDGIGSTSFSLTAP